MASMSLPKCLESYFHCSLLTFKYQKSRYQLITEEVHWDTLIRLKFIHEIEIKSTDPTTRLKSDEN